MIDGKTLLEKLVAVSMSANSKSLPWSKGTTSDTYTLTLGEGVILVRLFPRRYSSSRILFNLKPLGIFEVLNQNGEVVSHIYAYSPQDSNYQLIKTLFLHARDIVTGSSQVFSSIEKNLESYDTQECEKKES